MTPNVATLAYLPPDKVPFAAAFRKNIRQFKTAYPLFLFSDTPDDDSVQRIPNPEKFIKAGRPFVINNYCFLRALEIAVDRQLDWLILMEADCRVIGDYWDKAIFDEFSTFDDAVMGGTPVVWSLNRGGRLLTMSIIDYAADYQRRMGVPIAIHGYHGSIPSKRGPEMATPCLYPNGAAAVYAVGLLAKMFPNYREDSAAASITAFDMAIGFSLHQLYGDGVTKKVAAMTSVFSGYGSEILTEQERRDWISTGRVRAVHQIKDSYLPP